MATGGDVGAAFKKFATKADCKEATSKDMNKWCTDAGVLGKNCNSNHLDISFSAVKTKGKSTITAKEVDPLVDRLAKMYLKDHKCDEETAKTQIKEKLGCAAPKAHGTTKQSKTGGVDKMTDTSKYTGAHKERFGADGKGKGKEGRADVVDNSGYVGAYKGEGTHAAKK